MSFRHLLSLPAILALLIASFTTPSHAGPPVGPAPSAASGHAFYSYAGGTLVRAVGTTISSDLTAQSVIAGQRLPSRARSTTAAVDVDKLVDVGAIHTSTEATRVNKAGIRLTSRARTANVSLLGGLIRAKAVDTTNVTRGTRSSLSASARTTFVDLHIAGARLPVNIPKNYRVQIPGVAVVVLNATATGQKDGVRTSQGYALGVWLLRSRGTAPIGSSIILNPTMSAVSVPVPKTTPAVGGRAYGTHALVKVTSKVRGEVGRTGEASTPPIGTGGRTNQNRTADVLVPGVLHVGAVSSTTKATSGPRRAEVTNTNRIAGVNLFNGLIRADAIAVKAHSRLRNKRFRANESMTFINLVIAGQRIPVNVGPNTRINIASLGTVVLNQRARTRNGNRIRGIYIKVLRPRAGLEVGAEIEVAVASTRIWR